MSAKLELKLNDNSLLLEELDVADLRSGFSAVSMTSSHIATPQHHHGSSERRIDDMFSPLSSGDIGVRFTSRSVNASPSTPNLPPLPMSARPVLSRSNSVPRAHTFENKSRRKNSEVDALNVDPDVLTKLRRWIHAFAIVDFDLDVGPIVNGVYPGLYLFPSESENIAFSAFPDSPQFDQGTADHSFRIRQEAADVKHGRRPISRDGFLYCYSHFTQRRDTNSKRGYHQRALVLMTQHQYPALFTVMSNILGPMFEEHGAPMLETVCHNIATWSSPSPGTTLELGFLGTVLTVEIPLTEDTQQLVVQPTYDPRSHVLAGSVPLTPPPSLLFEASLSHLWSIWECIVLCEPLLIYGASPAETSQAVWWCRDLMKPIPLAGDIRPYFTIHDGDHAQLVNKLRPKSGLILGVTNPFFERSCTHWPHVLSVGRRATAVATPVTPSLPGPSPGWRTKTHNRYISKDKALLKQLEDACSGTPKQKLEASIAMRRHFCSRTNELLLPLSRYLNTLIPTPAEVNKAMKNGTTPRLKPFNREHFFASLKAHGSTLPFRTGGKRKEFYERWLKTPSFGMWLAQQEQIVQGVLENRVSTS